MIWSLTIRSVACGGHDRESYHHHAGRTPHILHQELLQHDVEQPLSEDQVHLSCQRIVAALQDCHLNLQIKVKVLFQMHTVQFFIADEISRVKVGCANFWSDKKSDVLFDYLSVIKNWIVCANFQSDIKKRIDGIQQWDLACIDHSTITPIKNLISALFHEAFLSYV